MTSARHLLIACVLAALPLLAGCGTDASADEAPSTAEPVPVEVVAVVAAEQTLPVRSSGRLASKSERALSFKISGLVARVNVDEGGAVRAGQVLARLDPREIDAQVLQAESALAKAERDLARAERLLADSVATLEAVQDARTGVEVAQAQLDIAAFNRRYATITAPAAGRVLRRHAEPNELVQPGQPVLTLGTAADGWVVRLGVADRDIVRLALGDPATVRFDAYPGVVFEGRVTELASAADPATGTFEVEVAVPDAERRLRSGFVAQVDLRPSAGERYALVPVDALVAGDGDTGTVFGIEPGAGGAATARQLTVEIAAVSGDHLAVRSGLGGVAHLVTTGAAYLTDGAAVRVVEPSEPQ
ncbi:MAG: efflux RND transporter periplasmic adaptor subunit [Bacteroidota bacterium]